MLALTHLVVAATLGRLTGRHASGIVAGLASHALLDGVGHDDVSIGFAGQAALVAGGAAALALCWGPSSPVVLSALAGVAPDAEIALKLSGRRPLPPLFPSHWERRGRRGKHPYRFPGPDVPIGVEVVASVGLCAALCLAGRRRRRPRPR
jgi:hypothetical protein